ncbi:protein kinase [Legionella cherrii]|uniref:Serine/threonine-protein kinase n=1 Tax=Legionella cherrii TaxID=28084 RepID=A0ABY6T996_9GAMM|nr:protein kinase [Legionella cherrii]VEB38917.1 serine/threonine-protein kinase [Legionella cherrii]
MPLVIDLQNIAQNKWIWDFLENQRLHGKEVWKPNEVYTYNGSSFTFQQPVFARKRKNPAQGYAYEMPSSKRLGLGKYGAVYRISCTISRGKTDTFQVQDKHRVVKFLDPNDALREYNVGHYTEHLHMKAPTQSYLVMREMQGQTFTSFLHQYYRTLSRKKKLELTKAIIHAIKEQLIDRKLIHKDLHGRNILIHYDPLSSQNHFTVNVIDYGMAYYSPGLNIGLLNSDVGSLWNFLYAIWSNEPDRPEVINALINMRSFRFSDYLLLDEVVMAPTLKSQKPLDRMLAYLRQLAETHDGLAKELRHDLLRAVKQSDASNLTPMKLAVEQCKESLIKHNIDLCSFPYPVFTENAEKQKQLNEIYAYLRHLENKGKFLIFYDQENEGNELCELAHNLRQKTYQAAMMSPLQQRDAFAACSIQCKEILDKNRELLNIHRDSNYIWAEIGVVLCSLIVFYPIVGFIHYLATDRFRFFNQTESAAGASKMEKNFNQLCDI